MHHTAIERLGRKVKPHFVTFTGQQYALRDYPLVNLTDESELFGGGQKLPWQDEFVVSLVHAYEEFVMVNLARA